MDAARIRSAAQLRRNIAEKSASHALRDPLRRVVQAGGIAVHDAVPVAGGAQGGRQVFERGGRAPAPHGLHESQAGLGEEDAIRARKVDAQLLLPALLGTGDIGLPQQLPGGQHHQFAAAAPVRLGSEVLHHHLGQGDVLGRRDVDGRLDRLRRGGQPAKQRGRDKEPTDSCEGCGGHGL